MNAKKNIFQDMNFRASLDYVLKESYTAGFKAGVEKCKNIIRDQFIANAIKIGLTLENIAEMTDLTVEQLVRYFTQPKRQIKLISC